MRRALAVLALAFLLGIAGFATAVAVPSSTPAAAHATCSKAEKLRRQRALSAHRKAVLPARKHYFKRHKNARLRVGFVAAQRARLRRLARAAACTVPAKVASSSTASTRPQVTTVASPLPTSTTAATTTIAPPGSTSTSSTTTTQTVAAPPPATVVVVSSGFSQSSSSLTEVDYGIVLRNTSPDRDARNVRVTVNALDAQNVVLESAADTVFTIPAGATYYFGGQSHYPGTAVTARLEVLAQVGASVAAAGALPPAANVRIEPSSLGGVEVLGEVRNTVGAPLSSRARITAVLFDGQGKVIGGGYAYPESDVPLGARIGFEVFARSVPSSAAASAQVSIEPAYDAGSPASALLTVLKQGSSETSSSSTREVDYGVVLRNVSPDRDAKGVHVTVNAIDAHGVVVRSASTWLAGIPADSTYYFGGWLFHSTAQATTGLEVFVQADGSAPRALAQPVPGNVRVQPVLGSVRVLGDVTNAAAARLSSQASITAVIFDAGGNVVGGGLTLPESDVPPGTRVGFAIYAFSVPVGRAASAQVSVEPNYH